MALPDTAHIPARFAKLRACYFALLRKLGVDGDGPRHDLNAALVGKSSTRAMDLWQMQLLAMRVAQLVPSTAEFGVRLSLPAKRSDGQPDLATPPQVAALLAASHRCQWTASPEAFVRARVLTELRRRNWNGWWDSLFAREASDAISAMRRLAQQQSSPASTAGMGHLLPATTPPQCAAPCSPSRSA